MAKFKLAVAPTFKAKVAIPVPGGESPEVEFVFKHRTVAQLDEWRKTLEKDRKNEEVVAEFLAGWGLDDEFNDENIALLCQNYAGAAMALMLAYQQELMGARKKN